MLWPLTLALGLSACSAAADPTTAPAVTGTAENSVTTAIPLDLPTSTVTVGDIELRVWLADDPEERSQGLRGVEGLPSDIDGMLFAFETPTPAVFIMEDTVIPLDVWFFDTEGTLIGANEMTPCTAEPCTRYSAPGPVSWALETPHGELLLEPGDLLSTSASG